MDSVEMDNWTFYHIYLSFGREFFIFFFVLFSFDSLFSYTNICKVRLLIKHTDEFSK